MPPRGSTAAAAGGVLSDLSRSELGDVWVITLRRATARDARQHGRANMLRVIRDPECVEVLREFSRRLHSLSEERELYLRSCLDAYA